VAVLQLGNARQAGRERLADTDVGACPQVDPVAAAVGGRDGRAVVAARTLRVELDRAADRVAPGERALRTAQDLDAVEVEQVEHRAGQRRVIDVVDVEADARLERGVEVVLADAANARGHRRAEGRALRLQGYRRRLRGDLRDVRLAACLEHLGVDRGDRQRRVLQVLLAELGGDDDRVVVGFGGLVLRDGGRGGEGRRNGRDAGGGNKGNTGTLAETRHSSLSCVISLTAGVCRRFVSSAYLLPAASERRALGEQSGGTDAEELQKHLRTE